MVRIFKSFKFFRKRLLDFSIIINLIFIFPNSILAHETYGDAMSWYRDNNFVIDPKQNFLIGLKFEDEGKIRKALYFFKLAAEKGLTEAQIKVGSYLIKSDTQGDHIEARKIFQLLSEKEIPSASFKLGWMYENGIGGEKNIIKDRKLSEEPKTLDELSKEYKISRERIRQIEERAFQKLQMEMLNLAKEKKLIQA